VFYDEDVYLKEREQGGSRMTQPLNNARVDQEYKASIQRTEARLRQVGWEALTETLEALAEEVNLLNQELGCARKAHFPLG
jgi:hypothetical protein